MNYNKIGEKIRKIREKELKQTREEFAEEIGISIHTAARLENATSKVNNIEVFLRISEISGYTLDELLLDNKETKEKERMIRRINYILSVLSQEELEYICGSINQFVRFNHRNQVKTLKEIKDEFNK
ncbi:MAG: helix-turn-helix domain-containing protein [Clostridia bacterium]